jgi:hypothetical protein
MSNHILEEFYPLLLNDSTIQDRLKGAALEVVAGGHHGDLSLHFSDHAKLS